MNGLRVLITGGRAPCALDLSRAFAARGAEVYAAESLEHHLCAGSRAVKRSFRVPPPAQDPDGYAAALREIVRSEEIGLLLPTCEEIFYISAHRGGFGPDCRVLAPPLETLRELHSKWAFIRLCARLGFAVPETVRLEFPDRGETGSGIGEERIAGEIPRSRSGDPAYILKPEFSRFSSRLSLHGTLEEARAEAARAGGAWVAQRFAAGEMLCTYGVAHRGRLLAHAAYRAPQTASGASVCFEPAADEQAREWAVRFAERTNFSGQLAFDFIRTDEGALLPIECNPRATSGVHLLLAAQTQAKRGAEGTAAGPEAAGEDPVRAEAGLRPAPSEGATDPDRRPDLLDALARPDKVRETIFAAPARTPMLLLPMLGSGLAQTGSPRRFAKWLRDFRGSRDVLLRRGDAAVMPEALRMLLELRRRSRKLGISSSEASVHDIRWNGEAIGESAAGGNGTFT
ncbi:hypothetical protein QWJ34_09755 [Saccharibacillus sp. CPCC 101409]|uniref:hypothetical protein n=1 Tax=Saccharibacillus sp. CPCC 101409 TaxID=3058041 RepID=UPI002672DC16|nr:hypothetical protein [Saccharibacillus sp. CPCC 101409]MDO3410044.1 hypothetical protein [Saccharibacillus sp. CPCC 101409]